MGLNIPQKYGDVIIIKLRSVPECRGRLGTPPSSGWRESGGWFQSRTQTVALELKSSFMFDVDVTTVLPQVASIPTSERRQNYRLNLSFAQLERNNLFTPASVLAVVLKNWT